MDLLQDKLGFGSLSLQPRYHCLHILTSTCIGKTFLSMMDLLQDKLVFGSLSLQLHCRCPHILTSTCTRQVFSIQHCLLCD